MSKEAMQQALDALRYHTEQTRPIERTEVAIAALESAIAQQGQAVERITATEKDINRWESLIQKRPEGPWVMGDGGSFDRTTINPISDEMMATLAAWLHMGYTPWNGRSMPLSVSDRQFMYLLYYSVQGLVSRVRAAEKALAAPQPVAQPAQVERQPLTVEHEIAAGDAYYKARHKSLDTITNRKTFEAGFRRGWGAAWGVKLAPSHGGAA